MNKIKNEVLGEIGIYQGSNDRVKVELDFLEVKKLIDLTIQKCKEKEMERVEKLKEQIKDAEIDEVLINELWEQIDETFTEVVNEENLSESKDC